MQQPNKYKGIIVPAITPLTASYAIDAQAAERLFRSFYEHEISPFLLGTTGESASLSLEQKRSYIDIAASIKQEETLLYVGISSNVVAESIGLATYCADKKVDAVAATLPTYYALTEKQMYRYFETLANVLPLPLVIYNIPATTHMSIPLAIIDELSYHPNIIAVKDSERSEERLQQSLELWADRDDFGHFLGWAARSADALIGGSAGLIPSTGNWKPAIYSQMLQAVEQGDQAKAYALQDESDKYGNAYQAGRTLGESLLELKRLMNQDGICEAIVMPPL